MRTGLLFALLAGCLGAQAPGDPLTLIRVVRRHVSPRDPVASYRNANVGMNVIGLSSVTGSTQVWQLEAHGTFASLENADQQLRQALTQSDAEDELVAPSVSLLGFYRPGLSYRPDEAIKLVRGARYMQVLIYRSRPGFDVDFNELIRMRKAAFDRLNLDRPELGYEIISGANTETYLFIAPLPSLKTFDDTLARWWRHDGPTGGARGSGRQIVAEGDITREELLLRVEPRWSWSPEQRGQ